MSVPLLPLGSVLVVGGCGCLGSHIVDLLLREPDCTVSVLSRNPDRNHFPGVSYHVGDISNLEEVRSILAKLQPRIIFHTASPQAFEDSANASIYQEVNINGTRNLISCAAQAPSVVALIYSSSTSVVAGKKHIFADERSPVLTAASRENPYSKSKAIADTMVLEANDPEGENGTVLRTLCIRPAGGYGERDIQFTQGILRTLQRRRGTTIQLGDNTNLFDWVYAGNTTYAHVLAAKALLLGMTDAQASKVDGEAFFITDDHPWPFWTFLRKAWTAAGDQTPLQEVWVIPAGIALVIASVIEWACWVLFFGRRRPLFNRQRVEYCCLTRTYCIDKAKERLGYAPRGRVEDNLRKAVDWALKNKAEELVDKKEL